MADDNHMFLLAAGTKASVKLPIVLALAMLALLLPALLSPTILAFANRFRTPEPDISIAEASTPLPAGLYSISTNPESLFSISKKENYYVIANPGGTRDVVLYFVQLRDGENAYIVQAEDVSGGGWFWRFGTVKPNAFCTKKLPDYDPGMFEDVKNADVRWAYGHAAEMTTFEDEHCWIWLGANR